MFVFLSKLLPPLFYPLGQAAVLWVAALVLAWRRRPTAARRCALGGIGIVLVFSNGFVGDALVGSLEDDHPPRAVDSYPIVDAIVVLGGATAPAVPPRLEVEVGDAFDRLLHGLRLLRAGKAPVVVLSGGVLAFLTGSDVSEAQQLALLALECGARPEHLLLEERSRNTHENALYTAALLRERGWRRILLVTSARHMPRALGTFRRQGVDAIPAPTDILVDRRPLTPMHFLPDADALRRSTWATKEYVGYLVYWLRGYL